MIYPKQNSERPFSARTSPGQSDPLTAQLNKFGHVFQVYTQALPDYRASPDDIRNLKVKAGNDTMTPIGTLAESRKFRARR